MGPGTTTTDHPKVRCDIAGFVGRVATGYDRKTLPERTEGP
jgi:hypothetical protein